MPLATQHAFPVQRRAVVVGGSIAGLFAAAFLRRIGWQVDVYERSSVELVGRGVGIFASHPELMEALDKCGAGTVEIGVTLHKRIVLDRRGAVVAEKPMLQLVTSWDRLRQLLSKAIDRQRYHLGHVFERVEQDDSGVRVWLVTAKVSAPICSSPATAHAPACVANSCHRYNRSILAITSGAARRTNPICRRKPARPFFPILPSSLPTNYKSSAIPLQGKMNSVPTTGVTISHGTAWRTLRN